MMGTGDLRKVRSYVEKRIAYEQGVHNPLNIFSGVELREPKLDLNALASKYKSRLEDYAKFKDGYYALPDGSIRVVLIYLSGSAVGITQALKLKEGVEGIVARLNPKNYAPDLEVKYTGDVQNLLEERASIISDLEISTIAVAIVVVLVLLAYYRNLRATFALVMSLMAGTLWTFAGI